MAVADAPPDLEPAAEPERSEAGEIEEIVITARPEAAGPPSARVIERAEIADSAAHSTAELLDGQSAVHASTGARGERIFALRGFCQRDLTVLLDGAPLLLPYDGQLDLGVVPVEWLESAALLPGAAPALYGPDGLGGAVALVSRRPGRGPPLELSWEAANLGALRVHAQGAGRAGPLAYVVGGGFEQRDGFPIAGGRRENSDRQFGNLLANAEWDLGVGGVLRAGGFWLDGERGVPPSTVARPPRYWRFGEWSAWGASVGHAFQLDSGLESDALLFVRRTGNRLDGYDDGTYSSQDTPAAFTSFYDDWSVGFRGRLGGMRETGWGLAVWRVWAGAQFDNHQDRLAGQASEEGVGRWVLTAAPEFEALLGESWSLTTSLQGDLELPGSGSQAGRALWAMGPLVSIGAAPVAGLELRLAVARRTRFPTLKERLASTGGGGFLVANPDLRPEAAWHLSLEAGWQLGKELELRASVFDAEVEDLIENMPVVTSAGRGVQVQNIGRARLPGVEAGLRWRPLGWAELHFGWTWLIARRWESPDGDDRLPYQPAHRASAGLRVRPLDWLRIITELRLVGPQNFPNPDTLAWGRLGFYAVWDLRLQFEPAPGLAFWLQATNLTDAEVQSEYGFPEPGRIVWAGLRLSP